MKNKILIELLPIETERLIIDKTTTNDINLILKLFLQIISGVVWYVFGSILTKNESFLYLINTLKPFMIKINK